MTLGIWPYFQVDVDWTWPAEFVELVWGDGKTTGRETISATALAPFSTHRYRLPFDVPSGSVCRQARK